MKDKCPFAPSGEHCFHPESVFTAHEIPFVCCYCGKPEVKRGHGKFKPKYDDVIPVQESF